MKILKIARRQEWYTRPLIAKNPGIEALDYLGQTRLYNNDSYLFHDSWEHYLRKSGFEATDVVSGVPSIDQAWMQEHGIGSIGSPIELISRQIEHYDPDIVVLEMIEFFSESEISFLTEKFSSKVFGAVSGVDITKRKPLYMFDFVLSCYDKNVEAVRRSGRICQYFPHYFDPRILQRAGERGEPEIEVVFAGNLIPGPHMHDDRIELINAMDRQVPIQVYSDIWTGVRLWQRKLQLHAVYWAGQAVKNLPGIDERHIPAAIKTAMDWKAAPRGTVSPSIRRKARPGVFGLDLFRIMASSRAAIHLHAGLVTGRAAAMRLFETTGMGAASSPMTPTTFPSFLSPTSEVLTFSGLDEAVEKVVFVSENPAVADEIRQRGQARTLRDHTFENRMPILLEAATTALKGKLTKA